MKDVKAQCDEAVQAITALPSEAWANWVVYIMEALDAKRDYQGVLSKDGILERVEEALATRMWEGHW